MERMLDIVLLARAVLVGALIAATAMRLATWGAPLPWRRDACWTWAVGAGVLAASGATDQWPHWPALEDRGRFLTLLVPLTLVVETMAAATKSRVMAWIVRFSLTAVVAPILLHDSVYLADLQGHNSAQWSPFEATIVLAGLAALLALVWAMLSVLQSRTSTPAVFWVLGLDALATAFTVMLSGYFRGGLLGLGLAGALVGATLASYTVQPQLSTSGSLGMGVIGIFAVVLVGRYFGALSTSFAVCLALAPLLAWTVELPALRKFTPGYRCAARLACIAIPLLAVVIVAQRKFTTASAARSRPFAPIVARDLIDK
jgi:hypothetical protein